MRPVVVDSAGTMLKEGREIPGRRATITPWTSSKIHFQVGSVEYETTAASILAQETMLDARGPGIAVPEPSSTK
jgi:hypothetical protein